MNHARDVRRPTQGEAPFQLNEQFFSRTDERGVILAGNSVFQRVSGFDWNEMLGAPHKIIRHPDMPTAVFWLLWDRIQQGEPVGAYVKNQAKDGLYYWVFAIVTPTKGGYLAVRLKPSSDLLATVETEYAALLVREKNENLPPADSAQCLLARLKELGFPNYSAFMSHALATEMDARRAGMGEQPNAWHGQFQNIAKAVDAVAHETKQLSTIFESIRGIPYNMRILASRLEAAGGPISVISANYGVLSEEIAGWMRAFSSDTDGAFSEIRDALDRGLFLHCTAQAQREMTRQFGLEGTMHEHVNVDKEDGILKEQTLDFEKQAQEGMGHVAFQADRFTQSVRDMKRLITGLGATRMMCKIEGARLRNSGESLNGVIAQLDQFQDDIEAQLTVIDDLNRVIQRNAAALIGDKRATPNESRDPALNATG